MEVSVSVEDESEMWEWSDELPIILAPVYAHH